MNFLLGDEIAIEVKATLKVQNKHFKGLNALAEENICKRYIVVSEDKISTKIGKFEAIYWQDFLRLLWEDKLL